MPHVCELGFEATRCIQRLFCMRPFQLLSFLFVRSFASLLSFLFLRTHSGSTPNEPFSDKQGASLGHPPPQLCPCLRSRFSFAALRRRAQARQECLKSSRAAMASKPRTMSNWPPAKRMGAAAGHGAPTGPWQQLDTAILVRVLENLLAQEDGRRNVSSAPTPCIDPDASSFFELPPSRATHSPTPCAAAGAPSEPRLPVLARSGDGGRAGRHRRVQARHVSAAAAPCGPPACCSWLLGLGSHRARWRARNGGLLGL